MPQDAPRYDLYGPIHKGLRLMLSQLLVRLGATDYADPIARRAVLRTLRRQLELSALHLADEDRFIHPRLAERDPDAAAALERDHAAHRRTLAQVAAMAERLETARPDEATAAGRLLYLAFGRFVAEDLAHMFEEEAVIQPLLHAHFADAELAAMEQAIVNSLAPDDFLEFMRAMLPAMTPHERRDLLAAIRNGAPGEVFELVIEAAARPALDTAAWLRLAGDLALAA